MDWIDDVLVLAGVYAIVKTDDIKKAVGSMKVKAEAKMAEMEDSHPDLKGQKPYRAPASGAKADA